MSASIPEIEAIIAKEVTEITDSELDLIVISLRELRHQFNLEGAKPKSKRSLASATGLTFDQLDIEL